MSQDVDMYGNTIPMIAATLGDIKSLPGDLTHDTAI